MIRQWTLEGLETVIRLPVGTKFLCVNVVDDGRVCLWTDDQQPRKKDVRLFEHRAYMVPTGDCSPKGSQYVGSVPRHGVLWHIFVLPEHGYINGLMQEYANNTLISPSALLRDQEGVYS